MFKRLMSMLFLILAACSPSSHVQSHKDYVLNADTKHSLEQWKGLILAGSQWSEKEQLVAVNDFINRIDYVMDIKQWHQADYWASPLETIIKKAGDCEDLAIAKYFTLVAMGMDESKLRLTYAKTADMRESHIVLSYSENPNAESLVLDNEQENITVISERQDLIPLYSFNEKGLWLEKTGTQSEYVASSSRLDLWRNLTQKMDVEAVNMTRMACLYQYSDLNNASAEAYCPS